MRRTSTADAGAAYPEWVAPLLGVPLFLSALPAILGLIGLNSATPSEREGSAVIAGFFLPIAIYLGLSVLGVARNKAWGRGVATVAALFLALTGIGVLIAIPVLWGLWHTNRARAAGRQEEAGTFDPVEIRHALDAVLHSSRGALPNAAYDKVTQVRERILDLLPYAVHFPTESRELFVVRRTATDYLPRSIEAYLSLPRDFAITAALADGRTALQVLEDQLDLLVQKMDEIGDAMRQQDAERLLIHGRFLEESFGRLSDALTIDSPKT